MKWESLKFGRLESDTVTQMHGVGQETRREREMMRVRNEAENT